jgi:L-xylulokinase
MQMMVKVPQAEETGALGVCMAAAVGAGIYPRMSEAVKGMAKIRATYQPDPTAGEIYLKKYATFVEILDWMSSKL